MIQEETRKKIVDLVKGDVLFQERMRNHTSLRVGGPAEVLVIPRDELGLGRLVMFCRDQHIPLTVIGNGTKLLVSDEGISGIVVKISGCLNNLLVSDANVKVGAGYMLGNLSRSMSDRGLAGLEFAIGIPGTIGGGVVMNAGAHGSMISEVVTEVTVMDFQGRISQVHREDASFGYRQSGFQNNPCIILSVEMRLVTDEAKTLRKRMSEYIRWRKERQPQGFPCAGSTFRNPANNSAGKLIDMAGLRGIQIGNAKISEDHANFILNLGDASAKDVMSLIKKTQEEVLRQFGVKLEPEIRILGGFDKCTM